ALRLGPSASDEGVVVVVMALLSFADSTPRAYRLKVGNASFPNSTANGAIPKVGHSVLKGLCAFAPAVVTGSPAWVGDDMGENGSVYALWVIRLQPMQAPMSSASVAPPWMLPSPARSIASPPRPSSPPRALRR